MPSPLPIPKEAEMGFTFHGLERIPFKFELGEDEVLFFLKKGGDLPIFLESLEKRSLDTPACVEVRPSPLGGLGLFTTKDCLPGDLLLSERPMVSTIIS
jgi:hypothetical protein